MSSFLPKYEKRCESDKDAVIGKGRKSILGNKGHCRLDDDHRGDEGGYQSCGDEIHARIGDERVPIFEDIISHGADHDWHGKEEGEFGGRFTGETKAQSADNCCAGPRDAGDQRDGLETADQKGLPGAYIVYRFGCRGIEALVDQKNDNAAKDERGGDYMRAIEYVLDEIMEKET